MRTFKEGEEEYIRNQLLEKGRDLFSQRGIKKTSVDDITRSVRIGKGSFYKFFTSKEDLYFHIMSSEIKRLGKIGLHDLEKEALSKESIEAFLLQAVAGVSSNPILNKMLIPEEYECVKRKLTGTGPVDTMDFLSPLVSFLSRGEGCGDEADPKILANAIKGLFLLSTHRSEIGDEYFDGVMRFYASMIAEKIAAAVIPAPENLRREVGR